MRLQKNPLMSQFQIVSVDDPRVQLPQFVSCVPTLYIPSKRHVLTDADLFKWFDTELQNGLAAEHAKASQIDMANITGDSNILPFLGSEMGSGLAGSTYSFIEEDKNDLINQNYSFLEDRDINRMPEYTRHDAPTSISGNGSQAQQASMNRKTGGTTDNAYESMMKSRGGDMQQQRATPTTPNFSSPY